jgi:hypothetical protein
MNMLEKCFLTRNYTVQISVGENILFSTKFIKLFDRIKPRNHARLKCFLYVVVFIFRRIFSVLFYISYIFVLDVYICSWPDIQDMRPQYLSGFSYEKLFIPNKRKF